MSPLDRAMAARCVLLVALIVVRKKTRRAIAQPRLAGALTYGLKERLPSS